MNITVKFEFIWQTDKTTVKQVMTLDEIIEGVAHPLQLGKKMPLVAKRLFTGMKGINGADIYEGDIFVDDERDSQLDECFLAVVKYDEHQSKFIVVDWRDENQGDLDEWQSAPIVGNIYQNPELIK